MRFAFICAAVSALSVYVLACGSAHAEPLTYQGSLSNNGSPATGSYRMQFSIFASETGGAALATDTLLSVIVSDGIFTASPDFPLTLWTGEPRWIEIAVRPAVGIFPLTTLTPRQRINVAPVTARSLNERWNPSGASAVVTAPGITSARINSNAALPDSILTVSNGPSPALSAAGVYVNANAASAGDPTLATYGWLQNGVLKAEARVQGADGEFRLFVNDAVRLRVAPDGNVGIGTLPTASDRLRIGGDATTLGTHKATEFAYDAPQVRTLVLSHMEFEPLIGHAVFRSYTTSRIDDTTVTRAYLTAPVNLPAGAIITGVSFRVVDNAFPQDFTFELRTVDRSNTSTLSSIVHASATSSGNSAPIRTFTFPAFTPLVVAPLSTAIFLSIECEDWTSVGTSLCDAAVTYTVPGPK